MFDEVEFDYYMMHIDQCAPKPLGYLAVNHYMCAILDLHQFQVDNGYNSVTKQQLRSSRVNKLLHNVKVRNVLIAKENFEETLTAEFAPYTSVGEIP